MNNQTIKQTSYNAGHVSYHENNSRKRQPNSGYLRGILYTQRDDGISPRQPARVKSLQPQPYDGGQKAQKSVK